MNTRSVSASKVQGRGHFVGAGRAISLRPIEDSRLSITAGCAWVTVDRPHRAQHLGDHFLRAGQSMHVPAGSHLVMEPQRRGESLRFDWTVSPLPAARPERFAREVAAPSRELAAALGLAALAFGRLLRGLLGYGEFVVAGRGRVLSRFESNPP